MGFRALVWLLACGVTSLGCALQVDDASNSEPRDGETVSSALLGGWATGPFAWSQGLSDRMLEPVSSHVCVLSRMGGKFSGSAESVWVTHDGSRWFLRGSSRQEGVNAEATCFPRSGFIPPTSSPTGSPYRTIVAREEEMAYSAYRSCELAEQEIPVTGDGFVFLSGIRGKMEGDAHWARVLQSPSVNTPSFLQGQICGDPISTQRLNAIGFHVTRTTGLATFINAAGVRGDLNAIPEFSVSGIGSVVMAPASRSMCAFTQIKGQFAGGGESVQIRSELVNGVEHWVLRSRKGNGSEHVSARARCYARSQL